MNRLLLVLVNVLAASLTWAEDGSAYPEWLRAKIVAYQASPPTSPPRSVLRTSYLGKTAYYVPPVCCDIPSELYADDGTLICRPSGGFAGGDGRCPGFLTAPAPSTVVWRDSRIISASAPR